MTDLTSENIKYESETITTINQIDNPFFEDDKCVQDIINIQVPGVVYPIKPFHAQTE